MTRTIRIDDDVYDGLKKLADPFEDTPNSVIRKLLIKNGLIKAGSSISNEKKFSSQNERSLTRQKLTPQSTYEEWLIYVLWKHFDGKARKSDVTKEVINAMQKKKILTKSDFVKVSTGESKAKNTIAWGRNRLKENGIIKSDSSVGVWELTSQGIEKAKKINL